MNSATILIADRAGREEIVRAIRSYPFGAGSRLAATLARMREADAPVSSRLRLLWNNWAEVLAPGAIGLLVWLLLSLKHS